MRDPNPVWLDLEADGAIDGPPLTRQEADRLKSQFFDSYASHKLSGLEACACIAQLHDRRGFDVLEKRDSYFTSPINISRKRLEQLIRAGRVWHALCSKLPAQRARELATRVNERHLRELTAVLRWDPDKLLPTVDAALKDAEDDAQGAREKARRFGRKGPSKARLTARNFRRGAELVGVDTTVSTLGATTKKVSTQPQVPAAPLGSHTAVEQPRTKPVMEHLREALGEVEQCPDLYPDGFLDRLRVLFDEAAYTHKKRGSTLERRA